MMVVSLFIALAAESPTPSAELAREAAAARKVLEHCSTTSQELARQADQTWADRPSVIDKHRTLRAAVGATMPDAPVRILVYASGGHLADVSFSTILTRDATGTWSGSEAGQSQVWLQDAPVTPIPGRAWFLPRDAGLKIDAILADRCFWAEPSVFQVAGSAPPPISRALGIKFEVVTPDRAHRAEFRADLAQGLTKRLFELVTAR